MFCWCFMKLLLVRSVVARARAQKISSNRRVNEKLTNVRRGIHVENRRRDEHWPSLICCLS